MVQGVRSLYIWTCIASITAAMYFLGAPVFLVSMPFDPLRKLGHWWATRWGRVMFGLNSRWSCEVIHAEKLPHGRPLVVVANHQAISDIMALYHLDLQFKWISKASNFFVPFMGWFMFHAGYIPLRRGRKDSVVVAMDKARWFLDRGISILFFAEGTRSLDGVVKSFKPGAFRLALEGQFDILPIGIGGTMNAIPKHSWKFSEEQTPMKVVVGDVISTRGLGESDLESLMARTREHIIQLKADADARIEHDLGSQHRPLAVGA